MNSFRRSKLLFLPPLILISVFASLFLLTESVTKTTQKAHHHHHLHVQNHLQTARSTCQGTLHPDLCVSTLSKFPDFQKKSVADFISATVNLTINLVHSSASSCKSIRNHLHAVPLIQRRAIDDCLELLSETVDELKSAVSDLSSVQKGSHSRYSDIQTLLSGAMTNQDTCLDGFAQASNKTLRKIIQPGLVNILLVSAEI
ncbi:hypothetical protein Nepgr_004438 [Nepenthes gracilis]|uniref:Pectinesterase inhibitor domain-containing protein n=1 Tax=Nepenthes gracilis TaxID=150966 RepID=A0AAD3S1D8_NEPGR|nr:hypothetical protein Nepgr_004438 [Nepenthes gracilis]